MNNYSFWQVRNRSFMKKMPVQKKQGALATAWMDLSRGLPDISFNGESLLNIYIDHMIKKDQKHAILRDEEKLKNYLGEKEPNITYRNHMAAQSTYIKMNVDHNDLLQIIKKELLPFVPKEEQNRNAVILSTIFYQYGVLYPCSQAIARNDEVQEKGYFVGTADLSTKVNIYTKDSAIYVEEKTALMSLTDNTANAAGSFNAKIKNEDGTPLATFKNRFHIKQMPDSKLAYKHTDLVIDYNNDKMRSLYDKRSFTEKIKDFLKSIFKMNGIKEFTLDKKTSLDDELPKESLSP